MLQLAESNARIRDRVRRQLRDALIKEIATLREEFVGGQDFESLTADEQLRVAYVTEAEWDLTKHLRGWS
jgi:hypothetical protein